MSCILNWSGILWSELFLALKSFSYHWESLNFCLRSLPNSIYSAIFLKTISCCTFFFCSIIDWTRKFAMIFFFQYLPEHIWLWMYCWQLMLEFLQEIVSIYPVLSPPNLTPAASNRVCNALALLQVDYPHYNLDILLHFLMLSYSSVSEILLC